MESNNSADALFHWWTKDKRGRMTDLLKMLGISRATFEGWRSQGCIPKKYVPQLEEMGFEVDPINNQMFNFQGTEDGMTLQVIGDELGVSRERVRQVTTTALKSFAKELAKRNIKKEDFF